MGGGKLRKLFIIIMQGGSSSHDPQGEMDASVDRRPCGRPASQPIAPDRHEEDPLLPEFNAGALERNGKGAESRKFTDSIARGVGDATAHMVPNDSAGKGAHTDSTTDLCEEERNGNRRDDNKRVRTLDEGHALHANEVERNCVRHMLPGGLEENSEMCKLGRASEESKESEARDQRRTQKSVAHLEPELKEYGSERNSIEAEEGSSKAAECGAVKVRKPKKRKPKFTSRKKQAKQMVVKHPEQRPKPRIVPNRQLCRDSGYACAVCRAVFTVDGPCMDNGECKFCACCGSGLVKGSLDGFSIMAERPEARLSAMIDELQRQPGLERHIRLRKRRRVQIVEELPARDSPQAWAVQVGCPDSADGAGSQLVLSSYNPWGHAGPKSQSRFCDLCGHGSCTVGASLRGVSTRGGSEARGADVRSRLRRGGGSGANLRAGRGGGGEQVHCSFCFSSFHALCLSLPEHYNAPERGCVSPLVPTCHLPTPAPFSHPLSLPPCVLRPVEWTAAAAAAAAAG